MYHLSVYIPVNVDILHNVPQMEATKSELISQIDIDNFIQNSGYLSRDSWY